MKRLPRWLLISLVGIVVLVVLALVVPYFLDVDRYRTLIASAIEKETGRKITIGKIRARLLPRVGFVIEDFRLGNPPGFAEGNLLAVEAIRGSLAWGPLFRREFQLSSVELVRPKLILLEDERGQTNYDFGEKKKATGPPSRLSFRVADIDSIELTDVELTVGRVAGRKRAIVPTLRAWKLNAELADVALDTNRLKQWKADADLDGALLELSGLKGAIEFRSGNFKLRKGAAESKFEAAVGKAAQVKGSLRVADIEKAVVMFDLSTPLLDLDQLAAAGAETGPSVASRPRKSELVAQGRLTADRVRWAPYEATQGSAEARIFTDRVELWPVTMALYGGSLGVSARVDRRQAPERFSANVQARAIDVGKLLAASPGTRDKLTGTGELTLQVFGSLGRGLLDSLTGNGNFAIHDGRLPGLNLGGTLQSLARLHQALTLGMGSGGFSGETTFRAISGDLEIGGGRVSSNRIHVDSPSGTVDLGGSFGFDSTLDYNGQAVLVRSASGGAQSPVDAIAGVLGGVMKQSVDRITVPFAIRGTFQQPKIQPGRDLPSIQTSTPTEQTTEEEPQKKKSILDLFRRP